MTRRIVTTHGPATATEVRARKAAFDEMANEQMRLMNSHMSAWLIAWAEMPTAEERIWARYDRCCHGGRNLVPARPPFPEIVWYTHSPEDQ